MNIQRAALINELLAKLLFLVLPTACVGYFLIWNANEYFAILQNQALQQSGYFLAGMAAAAVLYAFRFRFLITFTALVVVLFSVYKGLDSYASGEFDTFFLSVRFLIFSFLFCAGWIIGAGFSRLRYWHFFVAGSMLCASILLIAKQKTDTLDHLLQSFLPAVIYSFYIIFTAEQIYNYKDKSGKFWWFMLRRLVLFLLLSALVTATVAYRMKHRLQAAVDTAHGAGKDGENGMLKKNKDGKFDLKDYSRLRSNQGRSNQLLFAAHIDNYFPGTDIPNPVYLTAFYYTRFDPATETFERDSLIPKNDLFLPDPSRIPMYTTRTDSSVLHSGMGEKSRRVVEIEVYTKELSPETYLAPHIGFFVQPIAVEKDFRKEFSTAFRAKGYVSDLNSAYFVYNADNPQVRAFQEQRFEVLRKAGGYERIDKAFMAYYTNMPADPKFRRITELAQRIAGNAPTSVDKVIALRDYFLSKDEEGKPLFSYTDNPGVPDIPSASKLMYFLFDNHKGYCAYYAGATLFMLRSLGIPSRITVGFMTVDRSDKNKGWYWYYADQAHAWVQVYFPGFGWLDFDTTVGDEEAQQSPKPDGTPPMQPPHAWLAVSGVVKQVDTLKKVLSLRVDRMMFHDKEFQVTAADKIFDVSIANIQRDSLPVMLKDVLLGDSATVVSYAEALKKMEPGRTGESGNHILDRIQAPVPSDDVYLRKRPVKEEQQQAEVPQVRKPVSYQHVLLVILAWCIGLSLLFLMIPVLLLCYYRVRDRLAGTPGRRLYWQYRAAGFYLHQLGYFREGRTPLQYASESIDPVFHTDFGGFMKEYLRYKYAPHQEVHFDGSFFRRLRDTVHRRVPLKKRLAAFLKPLRSIGYFAQGSGR